MPANRQKTLIEWTPRDLAAVDAAAARANLSRSEFIRRACRKQAALNLSRSEFIRRACLKQDALKRK